MSPRTLGLVAGAVVILGGLIYLFVQVQAEPSSQPEPAGPIVRARPDVAPAGPRPDPDPRARSPRIVGAPSERVGRPPDGDAPSGAGPVSAPPVEERPAARPGPDVSFEAALDEANKHYDRGDYDAALKQALANLAHDPGNVRTLRVAVSSACMVGDQELARKHNQALPPRDQQEMASRCERFGILIDVKRESGAVRDRQAQREAAATSP